MRLGTEPRAKSFFFCHCVCVQNVVLSFDISDNMPSENSSSINLGAGEREKGESFIQIVYFILYLSLSSNVPSTSQIKTTHENGRLFQQFSICSTPQVPNLHKDPSRTIPPHHGSSLRDTTRSPLSTPLGEHRELHSPPLCGSPQLAWECSLHSPEK